MSQQFLSGNMEFELRTSTSPAPMKTREATPFRIAILGDFSGRANRGLCQTGPALAARRFVGVDVDNFESLPARLGTEIHVPAGDEGGPSIAIQFAELEDFHPDRIFNRLEIFRKLKLARERLVNPSTFAEAALEVRSWTSDRPQESDASLTKPQDSPASSKESNDDAIERLLGQRPSGQGAAQAEPSVDIEALIRRVVKPYIVPAPDPRQADLVGQVDQAISGQMRAILHHPDFKSAEAGWRALHLLVSRVETDETLKLYVVDVSKAELAADMTSQQVESTGAHRLLVERSIGAQGSEPWALLVGCFDFDQTEHDLGLLRHLGRVARAAGAPFVAAASPHFAGCESVSVTPDPAEWKWQPEPAAARLWQELRGSPEAASVGLFLPRFLLRVPYGRDTESLDSFDFEEFESAPEHEKYLWGGTAFVCACLLAAAFRDAGWSLTDALQQEVGGLPMHVYKCGGETRVTPCAETVLTDRAMQALIDKGLCPALSVKGRDSVRIARFQSIAAPPAPLAGRWS